MKIPTTLKHKPVIVCENYEMLTEDMPTIQMQKGFPWGLHSGTTGAKWIFRQKSGDTQVKNGQGNQKNCPFTGCLIWQSLYAGQSCIFRMLIGMKNCTTPKNLL